MSYTTEQLLTLASQFEKLTSDSLATTAAKKDKKKDKDKKKSDPKSKKIEKDKKSK